MGEDYSFFPVSIAWLSQLSLVYSRGKKGKGKSAALPLKVSPYHSGFQGQSKYLQLLFFTLNNEIFLVNQEKYYKTALS